MEVTDVNGLSARLRQAANRQLCSERGVQMTEVDQLRDDGAVFVWYECSRDNGCKRHLCFILPFVVQKRGTYSKHSSPSSAKLSSPATQDVWLASLAESRRSKKAVSEIDWLQN